MELDDNIVDAAEALAAQMQVPTIPDSALTNIDEGTADYPWDAAIDHLLGLIERETSPYRLGVVLQRDSGLDMPVPIVKATYERLFDLGVSDAHTRWCYATYLLMHGPEWDELAHQIKSEVEDAVRAAGLLDGSRGHHPVFYAGPG